LATLPPYECRQHSHVMFSFFFHYLFS